MNVTSDTIGDRLGDVGGRRGEGTQSDGRRGGVGLRSANPAGRREIRKAKEITVR